MVAYQAQVRWANRCPGRPGRQRSGNARVDKHVKPLAGQVVSVVNPGTRGFTHLSRQLPLHQSRFQRGGRVVGADLLHDGGQGGPAVLIA